MFNFCQAAKAVSIAVILSTTAATASLVVGTITAGQIKVGIDMTYPPYDYFDDNHQPGASMSS